MKIFLVGLLGSCINVEPNAPPPPPFHLILLLLFSACWSFCVGRLGYSDSQSPTKSIVYELKSSSCTQCKKYLTPVPPDSDLSNVLGEPAPALVPLKDEGHEHLPQGRWGSWNPNNIICAHTCYCSQWLNPFFELVALCSSKMCMMVPTTSPKPVLAGPLKS